MEAFLQQLLKVDTDKPSFREYLNDTNVQKKEIKTHVQKLRQLLDTAEDIMKDPSTAEESGEQGVKKAKITATPSPEDIQGASSLLVDSFTGAVNSACIALGQSLGLYEMLHEKGPLSSVDLAQRAGFDSRFLLEWLSQAASAGILQFDATNETFALKPSFSTLLREPAKSPQSMIGAFVIAPALMERIVGLSGSMKSGLGFNYDGPANARVAEGMELMHYHTLTQSIPTAIATHKDILSKPLADQLKSGSINIADFGCGTGLLAFSLAKKYPNSKIHGYDQSSVAVSTARAKATKSEANNIQFFTEKIAENTYDLVIAFDVVHDTTNPREVLSDLKASLKPGGRAFIVEIKAAESLAENIQSPDAASAYGFSLGLCLPCSKSSKGGEGCGIFGMSPSCLTSYAEIAGFQVVKQVGVDGIPFNNCFVLQ